MVEETADADHLTPEQLEAWLGALESLRLFLGTQLDVQRGDRLERASTPTTRMLPRSRSTATSSWLQEQAVEALSARPAGRGSD